MELGDLLIIAAAVDAGVFFMKPEMWFSSSGKILDPDERTSIIPWWASGPLLAISASLFF